MNRREFIAGTGLVLAGVGLPAVGAEDRYEPYSRALYDRLIASGEPFMLDFYAPW